MRDLVKRSGDVFLCEDVLLFWDVMKCVVNKSRKSDTYLVYWAKSFPHRTLCVAECIPHSFFINSLLMFFTVFLSLQS